MLQEYGAASEGRELAVQTFGSRILALCSGQERKLVGDVPRELALRARLGYLELDLTEARFDPGVTHIDVDAFIGYVQIRFPSGIHVESNGHAVFGYFSTSGGGSATGGAGDAPPVVRVTGSAMFGFVEGLAGHAAAHA